MPVYFRRVQENHFCKSDRILNILTKAKSPKKHALEVMYVGRGAALSSTVDLGGAGSPMRGRQRGLLIGCWVMSDGPPDRPFGTVIPGRARVFENCRGRRENV
jgi:hypothetical protein